RTHADDLTEAIEIVRGARVMLDSDLAALYGVSTKVLLQSVRRNLSRLPSDFMFQLTREEATALRSIRSRQRFPGCTRIFAWRSGEPRSSKAAATPSRPTWPVMSGVVGISPSAMWRRVAANSSGV